jgi:ATP-binding cassette subfamily A (ABC1) protein 3
MGRRSFAKTLFIPPSNYGIGEPTPLRSFSHALDLVTGGRHKLVFVHNGLVGGDIEQVINQVSQPARSRGDVQVHRLSSESELRDVCPSSLRGVSPCIAAAVFYSSPTEGSGGGWNYSIRTDAALGSSINVDINTNDQEIYLLPFQHSIDWSIARVNASVDYDALPDKVVSLLLSMNEAC